MMAIVLFVSNCFLVLLCCLTAYLLLVLLGTVIPVNSRSKNSHGEITCFLSSDGIHTDFVVPFKTSLFDWSKIVNENDYAIDFSNKAYLGIGWGDKGFYLDIPTWNDLTFKVAANAMLIPSPTLVHIIAYEGIPTDKKKLPPLHLSEKQYLTLCDYISSYFQTAEDGKPILLSGKGYTPKDNFYHANEKYHAFNTCNFWINRGLIKIGVRTSLWSPTDLGIFWHLKKAS